MERLTVNSRFKDEDKVLKKMKADYLACPAAVKYINSLNIPEEIVDKQIVKINDFVSDLNFCRHCPGVDKCDKDTPRLCTKIVYVDGVVERQVVPCKKYLELVKFKKQFLIRDFPEEWMSGTLKKIDNSAPRAEAIKKYQNFFKNNEGESLYIVGEAGTGRSYLAANIALEIARDEKGPIAFIDVPSKFKELGSKKDEAFTSLIDKYLKVPVLVLDDLGNEYKSDYVRETILFPIINARSKAHLFTIITSDFSIDDICLMYQTNQASKPKVEQIKRIMKKTFGNEINLGSVSIYE
ncbi:MAG: ATP-binding protein [Bacilli bacterium]|nr:ATP-binding protein [Bacilli bacterium]